MERVRGVGGIFFKSNDPELLGAWYEKALGIPVESWGGVSFDWKARDPAVEGATIWAPFAADTTYFAPSEKPFMVNFVVDDLDKMLAQAEAAGATLAGAPATEPNGRFAWILDPEGNKVELWEPSPKA